MKTIYTKLTNIQNELKAGKSQYNAFAKFYYRSTEDILEAVKPLLLKYNASLVISDDIVLIGDRYYVKATSTLYDNDNGDYVSNTAFAREEFEQKGMSSAQLTGSTSSYSRKYSLSGLFVLDDSKDSDYFDNSERQPSQPQVQAVQQPIQVPIPNTSYRQYDTPQTIVRAPQQTTNVVRQVPTQQYQPQPTQSQGHTCEKCGNDMEYKTGTSKAGKPYALHKCNNCGETVWVNN